MYIETFKNVSLIKLKPEVTLKCNTDTNLVVVNSLVSHINLNY